MLSLQRLNIFCSPVNASKLDPRESLQATTGIYLIPVLTDCGVIVL